MREHERSEPADKLQERCLHSTYLATQLYNNFQN